MTASVTSDVVWNAIEGNTFAVLGWVTPAGDPRSAGIVYTTYGRELYISTGLDSWKTRHIALDPRVSVTVTIPKRVPFMPWIKVPAAAASFHGEAKLHEVHEFPADLTAPLLKGLKLSEEVHSHTRIIRVTPHGHIVSYGIGVPMMKMRDPVAATARVPV